MKNLQKTGTYLEEKVKVYRNISIIFFAIGGIILIIDGIVLIYSFISINFGLSYSFYLLPISIFSIFILGIGGFFFQKYLNYNGGLEAEKLVIEHLKNLDDKYYLINDVNLPNGYGNIDHIILGPNGIFVIETKNFEGEIICNGDEWIRHYKGGLKISMKGRPYYQEDRDYEIKSPSKQIKGNALKLKHYIESKNVFSKSLRIWVEGIVVFTHDNVILRLDNPNVPVLKVNQLCNYIRNKESRIKFSSQELEKIAKILLR